LLMFFVTNHIQRVRLTHPTGSFTKLDGLVVSAEALKR
jgi:hypothetical protein